MPTTMKDAYDKVDDAADAVRGRADALAGVVRDKPLIAVAVAVALGFLLGRSGR